MKHLLESDGMKTLVIFLILFLCVMAVGTVDYADQLVIEAQKKQNRPLLVRLKELEELNNDLTTAMVACLNGGRIALKDRYLTHAAECTAYKFRAAYVVEKP